MSGIAHNRNRCTDDKRRRIMISTPQALRERTSDGPAISEHQTHHYPAGHLLPIAPILYRHCAWYPSEKNASCAFSQFGARFIRPYSVRRGTVALQPSRVPAKSKAKRGLRRRRRRDGQRRLHCQSLAGAGTHPEPATTPKAGTSPGRGRTTCSFACSASFCSADTYTWQNSVTDRQYFGCFMRQRERYSSLTI